MTNARGSNATLVSRFQTAGSDTFATPEAAGAGLFRVLPFYSYAVVGTEEISEDEAISGEGGDSFPGEIVPGLRGVAGPITVPLGVKSLGWHLATMFGAPTTTGVDPEFTHVFQAKAQQTPRFLTNGIDYTDISVSRRSSGITYADMQVQIGKTGERDRVTMNAIGHDDVGIGSPLDATPESSYLGEWVPTKFEATLTKDAVALAGVVSLDATISSGITADQETINGLATAADVILDKWSVTGTLSTRFRDNTFIALADAATLFDLGVKWTRSATESLELRIHNVRLARSGVPVEGRGVITQSFQFQVARPDTSDFPVTWTLKNAVADYANLT